MRVVRPLALLATQLTALVTLASCFALAGCAGSLDQWSGPDVAAIDTHDAAAPEGSRPTGAKSEDSGPMMAAGEHLEAEISVRGFLVGQLDLWTDSLCTRKGKTVLPVVSKATREGLIGMFSPAETDGATYLDPKTGLPIATRAQVREANRLSDYSFVFDKQQVRSIYHRKYGEGAKKGRTFQHDKRVTLPDGHPPHDFHSAFGEMRRFSQRKVGDAGIMYAGTGKYIYRLDFRVAAHEKVSTAMGNFDAVRIDGIGRKTFGARGQKLAKKPKKWSVWISRDPAHLPLKAETDHKYGLIELELVDRSFEDLSDNAIKPCR